MSANAFWMFKWQNIGTGERRNGAFPRVLAKRRRFRTQGFDATRYSRLWRQLKPGDVVFCYRTQGREVSGMAQVVRKGGREAGELHVDLKPLKYFRIPVKIQALKRRYSKLGSVGCLNAGTFQAITRVPIKDAKVLAQFCRVSQLVRRSKSVGQARQNKLGQVKPVGRKMAERRIGDFKPSAPPHCVPTRRPPTSLADDTEVSDLVTRLLDRHDGDPCRARNEAMLAAVDFPASRQLMERVAESILQQGEAAKDQHAADVSSGSDTVAEVKPGVECSCGGNNKDCFRCGGTGIIQDASNSFGTIHTSNTKRATLTPSRRVARREVPIGFTSCPICLCNIKPKNIESHVLRVHLRASQRTAC